MRHNVGTLKRKAPNSRLMAVVKADAYGHGSVEVARACIEAGADSLAVVTVEEGAELRRAGLEAPILVFTDLAAGQAPAGRRASPGRNGPLHPEREAHRGPPRSRGAPEGEHGDEPLGRRAFGGGGGAQDTGLRSSPASTRISPRPTPMRGRRGARSTASSPYSPRNPSAASWCTPRTLRPPSGIPDRTTIASVPAWRSTVCTLRATRETRRRRVYGPRWPSRATSPACGGSPGGMGYPTG